MYSSKIAKSMLDDLKKITKADYCLCGIEGHKLVETFENNIIREENVEAFISSGAESQVVDGLYYFRVKSNKSDNFVLLVNAYGGDGYMFGRIALSEMKYLFEMGDDSTNLEDFFRAVINDSIMQADIEREAKRIRLKDTKPRCVFCITMDEGFISVAREMLMNMYSETKDDYAFSVDENTLVLIKSIEENNSEEDIANEILSMIYSELMVSAKVSFGKTRSALTKIRESYVEAKMAMEIADIFFEERPLVSYQSLGLGRIIYQLPMSLCELFMEETFGERKKAELSELEYQIIDSFFENNLSIAEVGRQLDMKRSTLVHRVEMIKRKLGLDLRKFEDAMTLKVALMVAKYIEHKKGKDA